MGNCRIAVDIGGTFVDAVLFDADSGDIRLAKALTTPANPSEGVLNAIEKLDVDLADVSVIVHGTTLGLNAIIERRGAKTGLITNKGFRDILEIGRGNMPDGEMYNIHYKRPEPVVHRRAIGEVPVRLTADGEEIQPLDTAALVDVAKSLIADNELQSLAVSFLYSYLDPAQEQQAAAILRERFPDTVVSIASDIVREHREYERTCTAVLEAYIRPIFERYIDRIQAELKARNFTGMFLTMRSSGGAMTAAVAKRAPLHTVLSGPAGGIVGAAHLAGQLDRRLLLTLDYGGTSLDACVIADGNPNVVHETMLDIYPALLPVYDIRCIGAGGGSIAWSDEGLLKVGPRSAGAVPGPIAYDRGGLEPTTTDAAVTLGFLHPSSFKGGEISLNVDKAKAGVKERLADKMNLDAVGAAAGVFRVIAAQTVGALRQITVERGLDPKDFSIVGFGGAGPLIAPLIAIEMEISEAIIPRFPSVFSAWGMMTSDLMTDQSQTYIAELTPENLEAAEGHFKALEDSVTALLDEQHVERGQQQLLRRVDMRYLGQEHTLSVSLAGNPSIADLAERFHSLHFERYGHRIDEALEIVNLRVTGVGALNKPELQKMEGGVASGTVAAPVAEREAFCFVRNAMAPFKIHDRHALRPGHVVAGPAILDEGTSSTVIYTGQTITVDDYGYLIIRSDKK